MSRSSMLSLELANVYAKQNRWRLFCCQTEAECQVWVGTIWLFGDKPESQLAVASHAEILLARDASPLLA